MRFVALVVSLMVISSCVDSDEELSETTQAVTWTTVTYVDCTVQNCHHAPGVYVGDAANQTCFLAGVTGHIARPADVGGGLALVSIDASTNQWRVTADAHIHMVGVTCVSSVANRVYVATHNSTTLIGNLNQQRQCFLAGLQFGTKNESFNDIARTYNSHGYWYVSVNMANGGDGWAWAVCIDVPVKLGTWSNSHNADGTVSSPLATVQNSGACGLTSLNGFTDTTGPDPAVAVNTVIPTQWTWRFDEHVGASAACVQPF